MLNERHIARDFLRKHNMLADDIGFSEGVDTFILEMEKGLSDKSSLPMLPTYLSLDSMNLKNEKVIVVDAGGTNFRRALVSFDENGSFKITDFSKHRMPGTSGELDARTFFSEMAELVRPLIDESDKIGFCFSYAVEMTKEIDGKILSFSKELKVNGAEGLLIGKSLLNALGTPEKKIVLLNDTVASLLAGVATYRERKFSSYAGFILGTGTNTAYVERNACIKKDADISGKPGSMIVNMESGCMNKMPDGDIDMLLTNSMRDPDGYRFEKMISGAYLGTNLLFALRTAAGEGLFSAGFAESLKGLKAIEGKDMDEFFLYPFSGGVISALCKNDSERLLVYHIADCITERAAKLAAINLASVVKKSGAGENPLLPVCIIAEGSTYYKAMFVRDRISCYLKRYMNDEMGLYADVLPVEDATLLGSAIAGLIG